MLTSERQDSYQKRKKDYYDSEFFLFSGRLLNSSRRRRRREEGRERREKGSAIEVDVGVDGAQSEINVDRRLQGGGLAQGRNRLYNFSHIAREEDTQLHFFIVI